MICGLPVVMDSAADHVGALADALCGPRCLHLTIFCFRGWISQPKHIQTNSIQLEMMRHDDPLPPV